MASTSAVAAAAIAFVGSHFLLSHPLRGLLVRAIGEKGFLGVYSLVAFATFGWLIVAYVHAPLTAPLWLAGDVLWGVATVVMLIASILLMGSLIRNPAIPTGGQPGPFPETPRGVFAITRHPMMWSFALWGLCHAAVFPVAKSLILAAAVVFLALVGAALQDRKKERLQPDLWPVWESKTSYLPFAAIAAGRAQFRRRGLAGAGPAAPAHARFRRRVRLLLRHFRG